MRLEFYIKLKLCMYTLYHMFQNKVKVEDLTFHGPTFFHYASRLVRAQGCPAPAVTLTECASFTHLKWCHAWVGDPCATNTFQEAYMHVRLWKATLLHLKGTVSLVRARAGYSRILGNKTANQNNDRDFATKSLSLIWLAAEAKWRLPESQLDL